MDDRSKTIDTKLIDNILEIKHSECSDMLCNICMQPMTIESKHNLTYHNKCESIRFPGLCDCTKFMLVNPFSWFNKLWSPKMHQYYPKEVRKEIMIVLLMYKRKIFKKGLSKDTLYYLFGFIATLNGRKIIDGNVIYNTCTLVRCRDNVMCQRCHVVSDDFSSKEACTDMVCLTCNDTETSETIDNI